MPMAEVFKSIIEPLQTSAAVKSVFGEAISGQGKTIIPVARIAYGFGGGSGKGAHPNKNSDDKQTEGEAGGGGGGVVAIPLGVYEVTESATRFIPLHEHRKLLGGVLLGVSLGMVLARRGRNSRH
jgi:uncharacterized spore protein YtfJ